MAREIMRKNKDFIFYVGIALITFSVFLAVVSISSQQKKQAYLNRLIQLNAIENRLQGIFSAINDFPGSAGKDLLFLRSLSSVVSLFNGSEPANYARQDLSRFLENSGVYEEFFARSGSSCLLSVSVSGDGGESDLCVGASDDLSGKGVRISPLTLYEAKNGDKVPALFYSIASLSGNGSLTAVVNANYFLEEIRRLKRNGEVVYLLSGDGSYVANPDRVKERIFGGNANFYEEYPEVLSGSLVDASVNHFEYGGKVFTFLRIVPTVSNFILYDGDDSEPGGIGSYWIIAAVSDGVAVSGWRFELSGALIIFSIVLTHLLLLLLFIFLRRLTLTNYAQH